MDSVNAFRGFVKGVYTAITLARIAGALRETATGKGGGANMPQRIRGLLCSIGGSIGWGFSGACVQCLSSQYGLGVLELTSIRMVSAGLILLALLQLRGHQLKFSALKNPRTLLKIVAFGLAGVFSSQFTYAMAIASTNAGTATVLCCLNSVMLLAVVCIAARRLPLPAEASGIVLALVSVWLIATGGNPASLAISPDGLFWGIACAAGVTFYTMFSKPLMAKLGSIPVLAAGMLFGGIGGTACAVPQWSFPALDLSGWLMLACVVILGTVVTFSLFFRAVMDLSAVEVGSLSVLEPVAATILSAVWLHSAFSSIDYVAFAMMAAMVVLVSIAGNAKSTPRTFSRPKMAAIFSLRQIRRPAGSLRRAALR